MKLVSRNLYKSLLRAISSHDEKVARLLEAFLKEKAPTRRARMERVAEIKAVLAALGKIVPEEAGRIVEIAYEQTRRATLKEPKIDLFPEVSNFSRIHRDAINLLTDNLVSTLGEASTTLGRRSEDVIRRHGLRTAAEQLMREQPEGGTVAKMERRLRADGMTAFIDRAGRRWSLTVYSRMALRTTIAEAQAQATINAMYSRGLDLVEVVHTEKHGGHPEDECTQYEGVTWSLTGRTPGYPRLPILPPFHPNCDHWLKPSAEGLSAALRDRDKAAAA